jgi:DNA-binding CsgD family transcriptional regulator
MQPASKNPEAIASKFVETATKSETIDCLDEAFSEAARQLGFDNWIVNVFVPPYQLGGAKRPINNLKPAWLKIYLEQRYFEIDPVHQGILTNSVPFLWSEVRAAKCKSKRQLKLIADAQLYGVADGITLSVREPSHGIIAISMTTAEHSLDARTQNAFHLIAIHTAEAICRLMPNQEISDSVTRSVELTDREAAVLAQLAEGATTKAVAVHFGVSERTVRFHMDNIKDKYGTMTIIQATALAIANGDLENS